MEHNASCSGQVCRFRRGSVVREGESRAGARCVIRAGHTRGELFSDSCLVAKPKRPVWLVGS